MQPNTVLGLGNRVSYKVLDCEESLILIYGHIFEYIATLTQLQPFSFFLGHFILGRGLIIRLYVKSLQRLAKMA